MLTRLLTIIELPKEDKQALIEALEEGTQTTKDWNSARSKKMAEEISQFLANRANAKKGEWNKEEPLRKAERLNRVSSHIKNIIWSA